MPFAQIPQLSKVTETFAYDATDPSFGAPAPSGATRIHVHPTYGVQVYQMRLNESGALLAGNGVVLATGTLVAGQSISAKSAAASTPAVWGGIVQNVVPDDYWCWVLIEGDGICLLSTDDVADNGLVYTLDTGLFDDGAGAVTSLIVGTFRETMTTNSGTPRISLLRTPYDGVINP